MTSVPQVPRERKSWLTRVNDVLQWPCYVIWFLVMVVACYYHPMEVLSALSRFH
jgi:hypothetical protein